MSQERLMKVLLAPHITEKASMAAETNGQYVFKVSTDSTKLEVKKAVELVFGVKVVSVQTLNMKGKRKRFAQMQGRRASFKKAYVQLLEGLDIDFSGTAE